MKRHELLELLDEAVAAELDSWFDGDVPCAGKYHAEGTLGHVTSEFASVSVVGTCGHSDPVCLSRADYMRSLPATTPLRCNCGAVDQVSDLSFLPL